MDAESENDSAWRTVEAVQNSCDILEELQRTNGAGVTELSERLDMSKAGIHSYLATLEQNEFVVKDGSTYRMSLRFLDFGKSAKQNVEIYDLVQEEVETLAEKTGEVAQFMVEEHGWGIYICKERGESGVQTASYTGDRKHLHCTGVGKAILSSLPRDRVEEIIDKQGLPPRTENTITDRDELFDELDEISDRGVAFDEEEILEGLRCVAVPVSSQEKGLLGAISVSGPTSRMRGDHLREELPETVMDIANVIQINASQL